MKTFKQSLLLFAFPLLLGFGKQAYAADLNPITLGSVPGFAVGVTLQNGFAYVASQLDGLRIIDVHNPSAPRQIALANLVGHASSVSVTGNYAYVFNLPNFGGDKAIVDVSDPFAPRVIKSLPREERDFAGKGSDVKHAAAAVSSSGHLQVGVGDFGVNIDDIRKPNHPMRVGGFYYEDDGQGPEFYGTVLSGNLAYLGDSDRLTIIDISRRANPQRRGHVQNGNNHGGVAAQGHYAYVGDGGLFDSGVRIFDLRNPTHPKQVGFVNFGLGDVTAVAVFGDYVYVSESGFRVVDVHDPANPVEVPPPTSGVGSFISLVVSSNRAFLSAGLGGMQVASLSDPASPQLISTYGTTGVVYDVAVQNNFAYIANDSEGLEVVNVSNPSAPMRAGKYGTGNYAVAVAGRFAYVGGRNFLKVIDIQDPTHPLPVGAAATTATVRSLVILGKYAYTAHWHGGVAVYDISNPTNPRMVGGNTSFDARTLAAHGNKILATGEDDTLTILNPFRRRSGQ